MSLSIEEFKQEQLRIMHLPGESVYDRIFFRKFSFVLTPFIAKLPVTPNMLTMASIISGVLAAVFLMLPGTDCYLTGVFLTILWYLLDVLDGDLARFKRMESMKGVYLDTLGHYVVNPLIFSSFCVFLAIELDEPKFLGLGFVAFIIHQYSRLATDVYNSVRYVQIDLDANPRQIVNSPHRKIKEEWHLKPIHHDKLGRVISVLKVPADYVFHAISMSFILGILRTLLAYQLYGLTLAIYISLILSATLGTGMIIMLHFNKLSD